MTLKNKTALITGGTSGIGYGIAEALLKEGMNVAITSRSQERADEAAKQLQNVGDGEILGLAADVRNLKDQQNAVDTIMNKWGQLDLLVANAGLGHFGPVDQLTERTMERNN